MRYVETLAHFNHFHFFWAQISSIVGSIYFSCALIEPQSFNLLEKVHQIFRSYSETARIPLTSRKSTAMRSMIYIYSILKKNPLRP